LFATLTPSLRGSGWLEPAACVPVLPFAASSGCEELLIFLRRGVREDVV
jgi:hypothetical protein